MKTTIIAFSAAALIAAAPAVLAQGVPGKTPSPQHHVSKKHHAGVTGQASLREMQARASRKGYPKAFGPAPVEVFDRETEISRNAGGGGGAGSGM